MQRDRPSILGNLTPLHSAASSKGKGTPESRKSTPSSPQDVLLNMFPHLALAVMQRQKGGSHPSPSSFRASSFHPPSKISEQTMLLTAKHKRRRCSSRKTAERSLGKPPSAQKEVTLRPPSCVVEAIESNDDIHAAVDDIKLPTTRLSLQPRLHGQQQQPRQSATPPSSPERLSPERYVPCQSTDVYQRVSPAVLASLSVPVEQLSKEYARLAIRQQKYEALHRTPEDPVLDKVERMLRSRQSDAKPVTAPDVLESTQTLPPLPLKTALKQRKKSRSAEPAAVKEKRTVRFCFADCSQDKALAEQPHPDAHSSASSGRQQGQPLKLWEHVASPPTTPPILVEPTS
ncbi:hypothetical protein RI367_001951 [Sorochytrium milnesiophthora]